MSTVQYSVEFLKNPIFIILFWQIYTHHHVKVIFHVTGGGPCYQGSPCHWGRPYPLSLFLSANFKITRVQTAFMILHVILYCYIFPVHDNSVVNSCSEFHLAHIFGSSYLLHTYFLVTSPHCPIHWSICLSWLRIFHGNGLVLWVWLLLHTCLLNFLDKLVQLV